MARRLRRSRQRRQGWPLRTLRRAGRAPKTHTQPTLSRLKCTDRKSLLRGTALASTLLLGSLLAPTTAEAVVCPQPPGGPIAIITPPPAEEIICVNNFDITNPAGIAIALSTNGNGLFIDADNTGDLNSTDPFFAVGIFTLTTGPNSPIDIVNTGDIRTNVTVGNGIQPSTGILALTADASNTIDIENHGDIVAISTAGNGDFAIGIGAASYGPFPTGPIYIWNEGEITAITGNAAFSRAYGVVGFTGPSSSIEIVNQGDIVATAGNGANALVRGLAGRSNGASSPIEITNRDSPINVTAGNGASARSQAIWGRTYFDNSEVRIENSGDLTAIVGNGSNLAPEANAAGILAYTGNQAANTGANSPVYIVNRGEISAAAGQGNNLIVFGVGAQTVGSDSLVDVYNSGDITATAGDGNGLFVFGIGTRTLAVTPKSYSNSPIDIVNIGDIVVTAGDGLAARVTGIYAHTFGADSSIDIVNHGDLVATAGRGDFTSVSGIYAEGGNPMVPGGDRPVNIVNSGDIRASVGHGASTDAGGIVTRSWGDDSPINIQNSGYIDVTVGNGDGTSAYGIQAYARNGDRLSVDIENSGDIAVTVGNGPDAVSFGIQAQTRSVGGSVNIVNRGGIAVTAGNGYQAGALGIIAVAEDSRSRIDIVNESDIVATTGNGDGAIAAGILGFAINDRSPVGIVNRGDVAASVGTGAGAQAIGIYASARGPTSPVEIENSGSVFGSTAGIATFSYTATTIVNSGNVSASSLLAIDAGGASTFFPPGVGRGAAAQIFNTGRITGFVNTTDESDTFLNQAGGVFETKLTSNFFGGNDLFRNEAGGTILAATNPNVREFSSFINLNRFESQGLITLQDGQVGDVFEISNTVGGRDSSFAASGGSQLAVDAFLGPPGSTADNLIINGNVSGRTPVTVFNTNPGPGSLNTEGIPVVIVQGNVNKNAFFLPQPIDTGFFTYDMFFEPTGSGIFELRNFAGPGARVLPQIVTAAHDIWYLSASTWFDRTADLRVLLNGGAAPIAYDPTAKYADGVPQGPAAFTPAVWARGAGSWLDRDKSESVTAFGNTYRFNLDRELDIIDFQMGLDLGKRDLFSANDILVFGMLGGFVHADLDYKQLNRDFNFSGGQVGGYATYLKGGLFVDTLLNVHLLDLETATLGFPSSLDVTTVGLRTDTGYRFGSFSGGAFIEPLATLLVTWADIDGFSLGGNTVSFDDDANLRGRLGVRVGTSYPVWGTTVLEPFVIGSLWGNLSDDNQATLTSTGTTFRFEDGLDGVWGEVSLGANLFTPSAGTAVFAKLDVIFGDDIDGLSGKAGMRVNW